MLVDDREEALRLAWEELDAIDRANGIDLYPEPDLIPKVQKGRSRDAVLFIGGAAGLFSETFVQAEARAALLVFFSFVMSLPWFLYVSDQEHPETDDTGPR